MSRDEGFAIADVDTGLLADPKIVALARRLRDPVQTAAHVALYQALILASWGAGERITFDDAVPAWWLESVDEIRANLAAVDLIDGEGRIPAHAWEAWFDPAWQRRDTTRKRWRRANEKRTNSGHYGDDTSQSPRGDTGGTATTVRTVRTVRSVPSVPTDPSESRATRERPPEVLADAR